jgi:hypothetical protein
MDSSTTAKKNSSYSLQPTKPYGFEKCMSTEQRGRYLTALETCKALTQKHGVHHTIAMKSAGFTYTANDDTVQCDACKLEVSGWTLDMIPFTIHAQRSPACPFVRSILPTEKIALPSMITLPTVTDESNDGEILFQRQNTRASEGKRQSNVLTELEKMKQMRKRTFSHWPHSTSPSRAQMIEAGFFGCNVGDRVICLYCNIICQQWTSHMHHPFEVHKTLSPRCPYVVAILVDLEGAGANEPNKPFETSEVNVGRGQLQILDEDFLLQLVTERLDLPISQSLLSRNFDLSIIKRCYEDQLRLQRKLTPRAHYF